MLTSFPPSTSSPDGLSFFSHSTKAHKNEKSSTTSISSPFTSKLLQLSVATLHIHINTTQWKHLFCCFRFVIHRRLLRFQHTVGSLVSRMDCSERPLHMQSRSL